MFYRRVTKLLLQEFPGLLFDDEAFSMLTNAMTSSGMESLLSKPDNWFREPKFLAFSVVMMEDTRQRVQRRLAEEQEDSGGGKGGMKREKKHPLKAGNLKTMRDLNGDGKRGVTLFFALRASCTCLNNMYCKEVKAQPRMGRCQNCDKSMEYKALKKCRRCKLAQYCDRDCQLEDWSEHKSYCNRTIE